MNTDTEELANINHGPSKETFLHYYKELWINKLSSTQLLEYRKILKEIKVMEELKETLKKMKNHLVKITLILSFINKQETHFMRDYWFFNII